MKKKIILLPLLVLALTACDGFDLNNLMGGSGNNNNNASVEPAERSSVTPNDVAIKIADMVSVFPEVGDEVDMSEYIEFDTGTDYKLADFTFTSSNQEVIKIENGYHATCIGEGYTGITVSGPGLNTPVTISFYVGSIAGNYVPDSRALSGVVALNVTGNFTDGYAFNLKVTDNGRQYNKRDIVSSESSGSLVKNISPFLPFHFDGAAPSSFEPITSFISSLVPDASEFSDIGQDVYGFMTADPDLGVLIKVRFNETFVTLVAE